MATENNRPFVMTCDAVDAAVEDETVHITVPFKVEKQDDEPRGDDAGEGEPTSQVTTDAAPTPPGVKHEGKLIHIVRRIRVVPEKVEDEAKDALAKDEAIAMDKRPVALSAADCTAKNPLRCPYHGAAAMSEKFAEILKKHGLGDMKFSIKPFDDEDAEDKSYVLDFECPEEYAETNGMEALKEFGKLKGIVIDTEDTEGLIEKTEEDRREALFEVDFFDKDAEDPKTDAGEEATEEAKEEATPEATEKPVEAPKADEAPKATEDTPKAPETASEPPKTEEEPKKDPKDDFEEDTKAPEKAPEDDFEEDTKKPEHEPAKPSKDIPKDPVERALKAIEDFDGMVSGARIHKIEEAKGNCDSCAKDIDFLKKAIDGAPNDRVKKMLESKLEAAAKEMDIYQSELKHACGDAMRELKDSIDDKISGKAACELKMEHGSGSEVRKEIESLKKEAGLKSITKIDGYKELNKAQKAFSEADAALTSLSEEYDEASANDDYRRMIDVADKINDQIKKCNTASDNLKLARENVKASLVKKVDAVRKARYAASPERMKAYSPIMGEGMAEYRKRIESLGMKVPVSLDSTEYVKSDEYKSHCKKLGYSDTEIANAAAEAESYETREKKSMEVFCRKMKWIKADGTVDIDRWNKETEELTSKVNELLKDAVFGSRVWSLKDSWSKGNRMVLNAILGGDGEEKAHLMNQMESGASCGSDFSDITGKGGDRSVSGSTRCHYSHMHYGGSYHMPSDKYEKYGCFGAESNTVSGTATEGASGYGDCYIVYKKDKVVPTITYGDSCHNWNAERNKAEVPPLITKVTPAISNSSNYSEVKSRIMACKTAADLARTGSHNHYMELHFHNENINHEFIDKVLIPDETAFKTLNDKALKFIREHKIKIYVAGKLREV